MEFVGTTSPPPLEWPEEDEETKIIPFPAPPPDPEPSPGPDEDPKIPYWPHIPRIPEIWPGSPDEVTVPTPDEMTEYIRRIIEEVGTGKQPVPEINPGTDPGTNPGTDPGKDPGTNPGTDPGKDPGTNPGTDPGTNPGTNPEVSVPSTVFEMFPFCIPWDVKAFVEALSAPPIEPRFEINMFPASYTAKWGFSAEPIVVDFSAFESVRLVVRNGFLILFIAGLLVVTKKYIWTGGG